MCVCVCCTGEPGFVIGSFSTTHGRTEPGVIVGVAGDMTMADACSDHQPVGFSRNISVVLSSRNSGLKKHEVIVTSRDNVIVTGKWPEDAGEVTEVFKSTIAKRMVCRCTITTPHNHPSALSPHCIARSLRKTSFSRGSRCR